MRLGWGLDEREGRGRARGRGSENIWTTVIEAILISDGGCDGRGGGALKAPGMGH